MATKMIYVLLEGEPQQIDNMLDVLKHHPWCAEVLEHPEGTQPHISSDDAWMLVQEEAVGMVKRVSQAND